jgi:galactokinase/mevalonate kinase-like predicted kinase
MVDDGWDILTGNRPLAEFGALLHRAWLAKRSLDCGISNLEIDKIYQMGIEAGAWGGKLLGAGAGGFMLFFAPPELHTALPAAMRYIFKAESYARRRARRKTVLHNSGKRCISLEKILLNHQLLIVKTNASLSQIIFS